MSEALARKKDGQDITQWEASATLLDRTKTIHFVRHAQATHNEAAEKIGRAAYSDPSFHDARLTEFGKEQCLQLKQTQKVGSDVELVLVSPCSRATETAILSFQEDISSDVPWLALECLREKTGQNPCDGRRSVSELKQDYGYIVNYGFMNDDEDTYNKKMGDDRETPEMITARAHEFFTFLQTRSETNILVVTHSAFLFVLFDKVVRCNSDLSRWFENCEMRTTQFALVEPTKK